MNIANINDFYAVSPSFPISYTTATSSSDSTSQTQTTTTTSNNGGQTSLNLSTSSSSTTSTSKSKPGAAMNSFGVNLDGIIYAMFVVLGATVGGRAL